MQTVSPHLTFLDALKQICKEYFDRMYQCESQKYDMEFEVRKRGFEVKKGILLSV